MNILLVTDSYPPEIRMISRMCQELAQELTLRGHHVTVVTSWPRYNLDEEESGKKHFPYAVEDGVDVIRVRTLPHHKVNMIVRGISELMLPFLFLRKIRKFVRHRIDAVIVYSPPLPLALVGEKIKKKYAARYLLNIQDIFPQNAIDLGIIRSRCVARYFEWLERRAYRKADALTSHTQGSKAFLLANKGISPDRIDVVPNWIDVTSFKNAKPTGLFREKYGLKDKFIFLFAGILGPAQKLDFLIEVARRVADLPSISFLIVGDGTEKGRLQELVAKYKVTNVNFQPFVSLEQYPLLVKEADVGLVCLCGKSWTSAVPGKVLGFLAAALPVVAFLNSQSDTHRLINEAQCGYSIISDDPEKAADLVRNVFRAKTKLRTYGENGRRYVLANCSKKHRVDQLERLIT